ncbi:MAG: hypothetical protein ABI231_01200 [Candidatus Tumulicola sp.]
MRDIGAILWVLIVIVGVVSSIVSNARKQAATAQPPQKLPPQPSRPQPPQPSRPQPPRAVTFGAPAAAPVPAPAATAPAAPLKARRVAPQPKPAPATAPDRAEFFPAHETAHPGRPPRGRLFRDRRSLVRAVIAAEVLGKPHALRDEYVGR